MFSSLMNMLTIGLISGRETATIRSSPRQPPPDLPHVRGGGDEQSVAHVVVVMFPSPMNMSIGHFSIIGAVASLKRQPPPDLPHVRGGGDEQSVAHVVVVMFPSPMNI